MRPIGDVSMTRAIEEARAVNRRKALFGHLQRFPPGVVPKYPRLNEMTPGQAVLDTQLKDRFGLMSEKARMIWMARLNDLERDMLYDDKHRPTDDDDKQRVKEGMGLDQRSSFPRRGSTRSDLQNLQKDIKGLEKNLKAGMELLDSNVRFRPTLIADNPRVLGHIRGMANQDARGRAYEVINRIQVTDPEFAEYLTMTHENWLEVLTHFASATTQKQMDDIYFHNLFGKYPLRQIPQPLNRGNRTDRTISMMRNYFLEGPLDDGSGASSSSAPGTPATPPPAPRKGKRPTTPASFHTAASSRTPPASVSFTPPP